MMDKTLTPTKLSGELGISPSTLRKYSLLLEEDGFVFQRNAKNSRQYTETDVIAIQEMITLIKTEGMTVENASYAVSRKYKGKEKTEESDVIESVTERQSGDLSTVIVGEIRELKETIKIQQEIIDGFRIAQEERDLYFVQILEEFQEEIKQLKEHKEQSLLPDPDEEVQVELDEKPKAGIKNLFGRLFKK